jgi:hypothetical protein
VNFFAFLRISTATDHILCTTAILVDHLCGFKWFVPTWKTVEKQNGGVCGAGLQQRYMYAKEQEEEEEGEQNGAIPHEELAARLEQDELAE